MNELVKECTFNTSRSGGKGGQNVNKVETKVELLFDVMQSFHLNDEQKKIISQKLKTRINSEGILKITCHTSRTQLQNKKKAIEKFEALIAKALLPVKKRIAVKVSKAEKEKRLAEKKLLSEKKQLRKKPIE